MNTEAFKIQVITRIPDPEKNDGNLADAYLVEGKDDQGRDCYSPYKIQQKGEKYIHIKEEVFQLGEIIIIDDCDREIGGVQRNACKWFVEYKEFELKDIDEAIKLSRKLIEEEFNG